MEYLTLQDIPHRHHDHQLSRRMTSHSSERPLGHMAAAVSDSQLPYYKSHLPPSPLPPPRPSHTRNLTYPNVDIISGIVLEASSISKFPDKRRATLDCVLATSSSRNPPPLRHITLPTAGVLDEQETAVQRSRARRLPPLHPPSHTSIISSPTFLVSSPTNTQRPLSTQTPDARFIHQPPPIMPTVHHLAIEPIDEISARSNRVLIENQSHHMRSSPPIQPGEQNIPAKLPSFSEFLNTTRQHTPPRTPSRRNDSADNSPHAQPHFEDVAWNRRGRHDTVADIYNRNSSVSVDHASDMRRMSNAIDPSLSAYGPERSSQLVGAPVAPIVQQHRPSHSYPPPHVRNQSPGVPHYAHQHQSHGSLSHIPYAGSHVQPSSAAYENRPGYYQEAPHHSYAYDRPGEAYYGRPQYTTHASAYDNNYGELRFQQHVGLDQNAFNRKRRGNLPKEATNLLKDWFQANRASPYPSEDQKMELCARTGLSLNQVSNWFINARRRQPQKEAREQATNGQNGLDG